jgi:membrane protein required for colicin V production
MSAVDWAALTILTFFFAIGVFKGARWQVMRLMSFLFGMALATAWTPILSFTLERHFIGLRDNVVSRYLAYFISFAAILVAGVMLTTLLGRFLKQVKLRLRSRLIGGCVGLATGGVTIVLAVLFFMTIVPRDEWKFWRAFGPSKMVQCSAWAISNADPLFPPELQHNVMTVSEENKKKRPE